MINLGFWLSSVIFPQMILQSVIFCSIFLGERNLDLHIDSFSFDVNHNTQI